MKKLFAVKPTTFSACMELTKRKLCPAGLLCQLAIRSQKGTLTDEHGISGWIAMTTDQWRVVTGYTRHQHNDAVSYLKEAHLVEYRRRKLRYNDRNAPTWYRLSESAKSALSEIMARPPISAYAENVGLSISDEAENACDTISASADVLKEMKISKNENEQNVIFEKEQHQADKNIQNNLQEKKQKKNHTSVKIDKFHDYMSLLYRDTDFVPEPYSISGAERFLNVSNYVSHTVNDYASNPVDALNIVVINWSGFCDFSEEFFNAYNLPEFPTLWALEKHAKGIPDFLQFYKISQQAHAQVGQTHLKNGATLNNSFLFDIYRKCRSLSQLERDAILQECISTTSTKQMIVGEKLGNYKMNDATKKLLGLK